MLYKRKTRLGDPDTKAKLAFLYEGALDKSLVKLIVH